MLGSLHAGLGFAPAATFVPTDFAGCKLWLRGDSLSVSGGNLTGATDKSGNGADVVASGTVPYNASAIGGRPGWTNAAGTGLRNTVANALPAGQARTIFVVAAPTTSAGGPLFSFALGPIACTYFAGMAGYGPFGGGVFTDSADGSRNASISPAASGGPHVYEFTCATATAFVTMKIDGVAQTVSQSNGCRAETGTTGFMVGEWPAGAGASFIGDYCEAVVYDSVLSSPNAAIARAAFGAYYGITVI